METNTLNPAAITVDTLIDENDGNFEAGDLSLREALTLIEAGGTIDFANNLTESGQATINLTLGALNIDRALTIAGLGADQLTIDGNNQSSIFSIDSLPPTAGETATIQGVTIANAAGDGIVADGSVTLQDSKITGSSESGISAFGLVTVINSQIENSGDSGINNYAGVTLTNSRIANSQGAGVESEGALSISGSEIVDNAGNGAVGRQIALEESTVSGNSGIGVLLTSNNPYLSNIEITDSTLADNASGGVDASSGYGGTITLTGSRVQDNGYATAVAGANITIESSSITGNRGTGVKSTSQGTINNSTIQGNRGAGVVNDGEPVSRFGFFTEVAATMEISSSTITGNGSDATGTGGVANYDRTDGYINQLSLKNTIVAKNIGTASDDISGVIDSQGYNLIGDRDGVVDGIATITAWPGDILGDRNNRIDPRLGNLTNNGGGTLSLALLPGSPAIDAGDPSITSGFDQRGEGFSRVLDGDGNGSAIADIGAIEAATGTTEPPIEPPAGTIIGTDAGERLIGDIQDNLIKGLGGDDVLSGRNGNDTLEGGDGNDKIRGGNGDDVLGGGLGRDILRGNAGRDTFVFNSLDEGVDVITDLELGVDLIDLSPIFADAPDEFIQAPFIQIGRAGARNSSLSVLDLAASTADNAVYKQVAIINRVQADELSNSFSIAL